MLTTYFENLSNEIFYEVFDYLDGIDIYNAFSNLNDRFEQLLNSSSFRFKIQFYPPSDEYELYIKIYKQLILLHEHQMCSFHLSTSSQNEQILSSFPFHCSLDHLESLVLNEIQPTILMEPEAALGSQDWGV